MHSLCTAADESCIKAENLNLQVKEETVELKNKDFFEIGKLYRVDNPSYPQTEAELRCRIAVAKKRIGEQKYRMSRNNCEHFAT